MEKRAATDLGQQYFNPYGTKRVNILRLKPFSRDPQDTTLDY